MNIQNFIKKQRRKNRTQYKLRKINLYSNKLRLSVFVSRCHIFAQLIDDKQNKTVCSFSTQEDAFKSLSAESIKSLENDKIKSYNSHGAKTAGALTGERIENFIKEQGKSYNGIFIDRGSRKYCGRLSLFVEAVRNKITEWRF